MARKPDDSLETSQTNMAATTMMGTSIFLTGNSGLNTPLRPSTDSAFGRLQSNLTNLRDDMQHQNEVLHGLQDQLYLKSEELDSLKSKVQKGGESSEDKDMDVSEQLQILRLDLLKKNLEIEQLQEVLNQTDTLHTAHSDSTTTTSKPSDTAHLNVPPSMSTPGDTANVKGKVAKRSVHFELKRSDIPRDSFKDTALYKSEIEDLKLKLKTATQICVQQENHFSNLVKDLEHRLCEAIAGRDELLTLRQHESGTQQQLIQQLQAALLQTKQILELKSEELSDCHSRMKSDQEKLTRAHMVLVKVQSVLNDEEPKRGRTSMLTGINADYEQPYAGDLLIQVLSNCLREDDTKITELVIKCQQMERQLQELKEISETEKVKIIDDYESKVTRLETDHTKSLDIAANRTLTERNRIAELLREIDENRQKYDKTISDQEKMIASLEKKIKACHLELEEKLNIHGIQHSKDVVLLEEMQKRVEVLQKDKEELLKDMLLKATSETTTVERISSLENQLNDAVRQLRTAEQDNQENEKIHLDNISQLKQALEARNNETQRMITELREELECKTNKRVTLEKKEASQKYKILEDNHSESIKEIPLLKEELRQKTDEVLKFMEESRTLKDKVEQLEKQTTAILEEKNNLSAQCESMSERIVYLQEEKSTLSSMIRDNVQDLSRAKDMIDNLQIKLDDREKNLEVYNKQDADLAELLLKKRLVGESLLQERQQIVGVLEEKMRENDELREIRDALAHKLESKIHILSEVESTCRSLETKLDVRSNELDVIMEDRNKALNYLKIREGELVKIKEERDSLVTLMNGKQSEKEREVNKLISRLKGSQHDLALTKKVLEAKREANGKTIKMATLTQEEITAKRKEVDALKDRIKWLQESLQATTEEKAYFENKTSELASELHNTNIENESLKTELAQFTINYDDASGRVNLMGKALEKAGIKFAESQALVERLEQDLAKIKLHYSLEVKELQRKVKSVPEREQPVQVVQPLRLQKISASLLRENTLRRRKELNATQQRLIDEAEMTKGFRVLLTDLHQLMSEIKDSGGILRKKSTVVERSTSTAENNATRENSRGTPDADLQHSANESDDDKPETSERHQGKSEKVKAPLRSSSPKRVSPDVNYNKKDDVVLEYSVSDISDVQSEYPERRQRMQPHFTEDQSYLDLQKARQDKAVTRKSRERKSKMKHKTNSSSDIQGDDVETLLMTNVLPQGNHERAQKILDLLTLKGQELTTGNKKIAELIGRQHDGIKRCREAEQNIKRILK